MLERKRDNEQEALPSLAPQELMKVTTSQPTM